MIIKLGSDRWSRKWKTFLDDIFVYWGANPGQWWIIACGIAFKLLLRPKHSFSMLQLGHISYQSKRKNCWREKNTDVLKNILSMYKHLDPERTGPFWVSLRPFLLSHRPPQRNVHAKFSDRPFESALFQNFNFDCYAWH